LVLFLDIFLYFTKSGMIFVIILKKMSLNPKIQKLIEEIKGCARDVYEELGTGWRGVGKKLVKRRRILGEYKF